MTMQYERAWELTTGHIQATGLLNQALTFA